MKEGWKMVKLKDISENLDYKRIPITKGLRTIGKFPYYGASGIVDYVSDYIFDDNLLLISEDGANLLARTTPIAFSVSGKIWVNNHAHVLKFQNLYTQKIVEYFIAGFNITPYVTGMAQPKLNQKSLDKIEIPLPPLEEQHRIVGILDAAFAKIDALKANAEANLANAKALFQQVLAQELKPKEGWVEKKLGEIYDVRDGTHDSPKYYLEGYPLVTSKNLKETGLDLSNVKYINEKDYHAINLRSKVDVGDILFAMIGTIGNPVQVTEEPNYAIKNMALFKVGQSNSSEYLKYFLLSSIERMRKEANGTTQKFVSLNYLRNFIINLPPLEEQHRIVSTLDTLSEKCRRLEQVAQQTIRECDALKQSILRQAFSGEL